MMPGPLKLLEGKALSSGAQAAVTVWNGWDFSTPRGDETGAPELAQDSAASAAFHAFVGRLARRVLAPSPSLPVRAEDVPQIQTAKILVGLAQGAADASTYPLSTPAAVWCRGPCGDLVQGALEDTAAFLAARFPAKPVATVRWGDLHRVLFASPLSPLLPDFPPQGPGLPDQGGLPNDGGLFTVDVANFSLFDDTFTQRSGANVRIATELDPKGVRSRMVIPGGQVDRPGIVGARQDPHYMDQVPAWLANAPGDQPFTPAEVARAARARVVFRN
jgi:acyl-homoserine lactone acylase PvdQ